MGQQPFDVNVGCDGPFPAGNEFLSFGGNMKHLAPVVGLWDFGWLFHDCVELPAATSDAALIQGYIGSPAFHTSFLPSDKDETGIHGPFCADRITPHDFVPLKEIDFEHYLESIQLSGSKGEDEAERAKMLPCLVRASNEGIECYVLIRDERSKELFHEWGFVFSVFREFLFIGPKRDRLERFIVGYD